MRFFVTSSVDHLRSRLAGLGARIGAWESFQFADGERGYRLNETVMGESVAVVGSVTPDPGSLFDLIALARLLAENGSQPPLLLIPYLGYARQDRPVRHGEGSLGIVVAGLLRDLGVGRIVVLDVHSPFVRAALGAAAVEVSAIEALARHLAGQSPINAVVAPDSGARERARALAARLAPGTTVAVIEKVRPQPNVARALRLNGEVAGRHTLILDDMIDTGGTVCEATRLLVAGGAASIRVAATHGIFSQDARARILRLPVAQLIVTNSLPQPEDARIEVLDIVPALVAALSQPAAIPSG